MKRRKNIIILLYYIYIAVWRSALNQPQQPGVFEVTYKADTADRDDLSSFRGADLQHWTASIRQKQVCTRAHARAPSTPSFRYAFMSARLQRMHSWIHTKSPTQGCTRMYTSHGAVRYKNRAVLLCMRPRWAEQSIKVCVRVPQKIYIYFKKYILWLLLFSQCKMRLRTQGSNAATYTHHGVVRLDTRCNAFAPPGDALLSLTLSLPLPLSVSLSPLWDAGVWLQLSSHSCWALLSCAHGTAELSFWNRCCSCCCCCCVTSPGGNGNIFCCNILNLYLHFFLKRKKKKCHAARMQRTVWSVSTAKLFVVDCHLSTRLGTFSPSLSLFCLLLHPKCWWHFFSLSDPSSPCRPSYPSCRCLSPNLHSNQSTHGPLSAAGGDRGLCFCHFCALEGKQPNARWGCTWTIWRSFLFPAFGGIAQFVEGERLHYFTGEELLRIFFSFLDAKWQHEWGSYSAKMRGGVLCPACHSF